MSPNAYYAKHLAWAVDKGIVDRGGKLSPNQVLPREEMCVLLDKYLTNILGITEVDVSGIETFEDDGSISGYARESVYRMRALGIVSGVGNNKFDPMGTSQRCAASIVAVLFHDMFLE